MECPKCGLHIAPLEPHSDLECHRQQQTNRANLGVGQSCQWCGERAQLGFLVHKNGCPRQKDR